MVSYLIKPNLDDPRLSRVVPGIDEHGNPVVVPVPVERPLTVFLNSQEIVTLMTIGDYPDYLALGYLLNQNMLRPDDQITGVDVDQETDTVVVRTARRTDYEEKLRRKIQTSGCAQGTVFGDMMEKFEHVRLPEDARVRTSCLFALLHAVNTTPSLYMKARSIHGCVLCQEDRPLLYMEDVGRHNAVDKIAGYMLRHGIPAHDKLFYTTGRMTSEMVIKTVQMGIPVLVSRSGSSAWGVELAQQAGLTLISRAKGTRFVVLSGQHRILFDADAHAVAERRKSGKSREDGSAA